MLEWTVPVALLVALAVLFFLQAPLLGTGPLWLKKVWTRVIRLVKCGDVRAWNWTEIERGLYIGSLPRGPGDLAELLAAPHGLGGVVSLVEPWEVKVGGESLQELGIQWLLLPTPDYSAPKMADIDAAVAFIDRQLCRGRGVLVHCNAGRGRSVTVALAYLLAVHTADGWDRYTALEVVQKLRKTAALRACCETRPQWRAVRAFERRLAVQSPLCAHRYYGPPAPLDGSGPAAVHETTVESFRETEPACKHLDRPPATCHVPSTGEMRAKADGRDPSWSEGTESHCAQNEDRATRVQGEGDAAPESSEPGKSLRVPVVPTTSGSRCESGSQRRRPLSQLKRLPPVADAAASIDLPPLRISEDPLSLDLANPDKQKRVLDGWGDKTVTASLSHIEIGTSAAANCLPGTPCE